MQQCTPLLPNLFPRDSLYPAGLNVMETVNHFLLPGGIYVLIDGCVQTRDQVPSQFRSLFIR